MRVHDGFTDGKAEAAAAFRMGTRFVGAIEAFENEREIFGGDAKARVADGQDGQTIFAARRETDLPALAVVMDGVGQEVADDPTDAFRVTVAFGGRQGAVNLNPAFGGQRTEEFDALAGFLPEVETAALQAFVASVESREGQEGLGQSATKERPARTQSPNSVN